MPWVTRGLRNGILTSRYPARPDGYDDNWHGSVVVGPSGPGTPVAGIAARCPTGAISAGEAAAAVLDQGKCILCGRCVLEGPGTFSFDPSAEVARHGRAGLVVPPTEEDEAAVASARAELGRRVRALGRSVHVRHVDAGSDGSDEWEVAALLGPVYDVHRLGIFFTASPRHADLLLVTGAGSAGMVGPLSVTYEAMPEPRVVMAVGTDAISGGLVSPSYASSGGVGGVVPVDIWVPGSPPSPFCILHGILLAIGRLPNGRGGR
jgi:Ni,Fe-hydrogenase III small subunit/ferredoxin